MRSSPNLLARRDWLSPVIGLDICLLDSRHAAQIVDHYCRLDPDDRYRRFFSATSDEVIRTLVSSWDWQRTVAVGARRGDRLVGLCEIGWERDHGPARAELGLSVDRDMRNRGLATWLTRACLEAAMARGVRTLEARWLWENDAVAKIMRQLGAEIGMHESFMVGRASLVATHDAAHPAGT